MINSRQAADNRLREMERYLLKKIRMKKKSSFNPRNVVEILHKDGSRLVFRSAFTIKEDNWYFVFTEHHGNFCYNKSNLIDLSTYKRNSNYE